MPDEINILTPLSFGKPDSKNVLIQPVGDHELSELEDEVKAIADISGDDFCLLALKVSDWNRDLSPWKAPAVFGNEGFEGGACKTLSSVLELTWDPGKKYFIGGYSLAGLFALWAAYETDVFCGVAAASPSIWFPDFLDRMKESRIHADCVYLSLGDREEKTRNPVMATVGDCIRQAHSLLLEQGVSCTLEWNPGNHFKDPCERTAKAFAKVLRMKKP